MRVYISFALKTIRWNTWEKKSVSYSFDIGTFQIKKF